MITSLLNPTEKEARIRELAAKLLEADAHSEAFTTETQEEYDLFGPAYSALHAHDDRGVHLTVAGMPPATRKRIRKLFSQTIQLRNDAAGSGA